jgi:ABC-type phosphate transport system substrate-binding protein
MMFPKKDSPIVTLALLLTLVAASEIFIQKFLFTHPVLAQSASPTATPLPSVAPKQKSVRIDGSTSMATINQALKQRYETQSSGTTVDLTYSGTRSALQALLDGKIDLAAIGRALTQEETAKGLIQVPVSRNKIAMVIGPNNPFTGSLTDKQFSQIFRGEITDWSQVGGSPGPIRFIDRPEDSDTRQALQNYPVFKGAPFATGAGAVKLREDSTEAVIKELGKDGISYAIADQVLDKPDVTVLKMHGTLPSDPRYPFSQPLVYVYTGTPPAAVKGFLAYVTAKENQSAIEQARVEGATASPSPAASATASPVPETTASPEVVPAPAATPASVAASSGVKDISPWWLLLPAGILGLAWLWEKRGAAPPAASAPPLTSGNPPTGAAARVSTDPPVSPVTPPPVAPIDAPAAASVREASVPPAVRDGTGTAAVPPVSSPVSPVEAAAPVGGAAGITGAAIAAGAGAAALAGLGAKSTARSTITLAARDAYQAYAKWDAPEALKAELKAQGGDNLMLRLYDVTGQDPKTYTPTHFEEFDVSEQDWDRNLPVASDRDYVSELGYTTPEGRWLSLARSNAIRIKAPNLVEEVAPSGGAAPVGEVAPIAETSRTASPPFPDAGIVVGAAIGGGAAALSSLKSDPQSDVEAAKFDVGQTDLSSESLASVDEGLPDLPDGYGESRIVLMPRDPQWAYSYWDTPDEHKVELRRQGGEKLALRIYDATDIDLSHQAPHSLQQYDCDEMARDWYVPIPVSDRDYVAEIGYITSDGRWLLLARSAPCRIPPVYPSDWYEDQFTSVSWEEDLRGKTILDLVPPSQIMGSVNPVYERIFGLSRSAEAMRIAGSLFGSMQHIPGSVFGSAQMASGQALSSFEAIPGLLPGQAISSYIFPSGVGMGVVPTFSGLTMSGAGFSASMPPIRARKFWLVADAELIIYGATEPDATVTIAGRPITLNPDGTFRFQMSFQDGLLDFPILAVAADGEQNRAIHMKFVRETPERRTNTKDEAQEEMF